MSDARHTPSDVSLDLASIQELDARLDGVALGRHDDGYESARAVWNGRYDVRPGVIARCASTNDVVQAVHFAREQGLRLSVRAGGHSAAGHSLVDDGMAIDLAAMNEVRVDPERRVAYARGGATWKEFDAATHEHGLATTGAIVSSVGVGGLTLGGGYGWLARAHGMACDNLIAAEVVTAAGEVLHASEKENSDLFWALRGGGGNFGVVTEFEFQLHHVETVLGGMIAHPIERARDALQLFREFMSSAPDELGAYSAMLTMPDGVKVVAFLVCYAGDPDEGQQVLQPLLDWGPPVMTQVGPMPYPQLQQLNDEPNPPGRLRYSSGEMFEELDDAVIDHLAEHFGNVTSPLSALLIERYGGTAGRVPSDATAYPHRDTKFGVVMVGQWTDADGSDANIAWVRGLQDAVRPYSSGAYVNFLGEGSEQRVREAYGSETYDRLADIKAKYDPDNLFRHNMNIPPRTGS